MQLQIHLDIRSYNKEDIRMDKRLYRNMNDKKLCGVCSGIADYFRLDPTLVRLGWVVFTFAGGSGILAYIIAAIIIPEGYDSL